MLFMTKSDRITVDIRGLRDKILSFRKDPAYQRLSWAAKLRYLIELGLNSSGNLPEKISEVVEKNWEAIVSSDADLSIRRLREIQQGGRPTDEELIELGRLLSPEYDVHKLIRIRSEQFGVNGESNGEPANRL